VAVVDLGDAVAEELDVALQPHLVGNGLLQSTFLSPPLSPPVCYPEDVIVLPAKNYHNREDFRLRAEHAESAEFLKFFSARFASALSAVNEFGLRREACRAMNMLEECHFCKFGHLSLDVSQAGVLE
jgi:hypothetical protein